ncbi:MAG: hypothetical protein HY869_00130 [Chloroflexi bacterium]|nr:hypothetical protein [Chloroflexota bacterium]
MKRVFLVTIALLVISACSAPQSTSVAGEPTPIAYPQDEPTITPTAAITDQQVFNACVETITKFMQSNPCKDWDAYHALFSTKSYGYNATPMAENDPACDMKESVKILQILTVEEWWRMENNGKDLPEAAQPNLPGERVFFVKVETTWRPGVVPPSQNPGTMLMWMLPENGKCLIRDYGW